MYLYLFIMTPIIIGTLIYLLPLKLARPIALFLQGFLAVMSVCHFFYLTSVGSVSFTLGGLEPIAGITLHCDRLSALFIILTTFIFTICLLFGFFESYVNKLFLFIFMILEGLVITLFLSRDLFNIYLVSEVSTIAVALLIMFKKDSTSVYDGIVYLLINIVGMTFFLLGLGFVYKTFGTFDYHLIQQQLTLTPLLPIHSLIYAFLMVTISLKCALMPVFSWLPKAHGTPSAPSIISAILSGLYVKCGLYLFIRLREMFSPVLVLDDFFLFIGLITALGGVCLALCQDDLKLILAYSTISQIGLILIGLSSGHPAAYWGSIYHILNHAICKSILFLGTGVIITTYGTRKTSAIEGVFKSLPFVSTILLLAILGLTGGPLFNGSISKYLIQYGLKGSFLEYSMLLVNLGTIVLFWKYLHIFWGKAKKPLNYTPMHWLSKLVLLLLGVLCLLMGVLGTSFIQVFFDFKATVSLLDYSLKVFVYFISLLIGYSLYYNYWIKKSFDYSALEIELNFNQICFSLTLFLGVILWVATSTFR